MPTSARLIKISLATTLSLVLGVTVLFTHPSVLLAQNAQDGTTLIAIPTRLGDDLTLTAKPGETIQRTIKVKNSSTKAVGIQTKTLDFVVGEDGQTPVPVDIGDDTRWSLAKWITVAPGSQVLAPNQTAGLSVVIEVPKDALPGGHYAMILHQPAAATDEVASGAATTSITGVNQQVGTLVYLTVEGPTKEEAYIRNLTFPQFLEFGPVPFSFVVENNSDIHIRPNFKMEISNIFGRVVDTFPIESKNIFPLTSRDFAGSWPQIWGTGLYKVKLTMNYGSQGQLAMASTSFWLLPIKLIIAGIIIILTLIAMFIAIRRHLIHRKTDQSGKIKELEQKVKELEASEQKHG